MGGFVASWQAGVGMVFRVIQILFISIVCGHSFLAQARLDEMVSTTQDRGTLFRDPQKIQFEQNFCSPNNYSRFDHEQPNKIAQICWLKSKNVSIDGDYPEALQVTWQSGEEEIYFLSDFVFDSQASRYYGSQILRAVIQGVRVADTTKTSYLSYIYKEYGFSSSIGREEFPDRIMGTLPTGERFLIERSPND